MCNLASFVLTRGKVFWSQTTNSHSVIIAEHGLHEDNAGHKPNLVRVEIRPPYNNDYSASLDTWRYQVDQDKLPEWYDAVEGERVARLALTEWRKFHAITQTAGYHSTQTAGDCSTQTAGYHSMQTAGYHSMQTAGDCSMQTAGYHSTQTAGDHSAQKVGDCSTQTAGDYSTQTAGYRSTQTAGDHSTQTAGDHSAQKVGDCSTQTAGNNSMQMAGNNSMQTAGVGTVQISRWYGNAAWHVATRVITEEEAGKAYHVKNGIWYPV